MNLPNQLTVLRIILTPIFLYTLFHENLIVKFVSLLIFIIASLTDLYDGYIAKKYGYVTKWGKFLDPLADKILISSALIAFNILGYIDLWIVVVIVFRDFLITSLRSYAIYRNQPIVTHNLARWKTFFQMAAVFIVFVFLLVDHSKQSVNIGVEIIRYLESIYFIKILMTFVAVLTALTGILYFVKNWNQVKSIFESQ